MRKLILIEVIVALAITLHAQISRNINLSNAGTLSSFFTTEEKSTTTDLTLSGVLDARDFKFMRDTLTALTNLDISNISILAYTGTGGTKSTTNTVYYAATIPDKAFYMDSILVNIILPNSTINIGNNAFNGCSSLNGEIVIPGSITTISSGAFSNCSKLTGIVINEQNTRYSSVDGILYNYQQDSLILCPAGKTGSVTIKNTVKVIATSAFSSCQNITEVIIPNTIIKIEPYTFSKCTSLKEITIPNSVTSIETCAFNECTALNSINLPESIISIGTYAFNQCDSVIEIDIPTSVTSIGGYAFSYCDKLSNVMIPNSISMLSEGVFAGCKKLVKVDIPNSVIFLGKRLFYACTGLTDVTMPDSLTTIREEAFSNCNKLKSINIPATVELIGQYAFYNCTGLRSIYSYAPVHISLSANTLPFWNVNTDSCILYVPVGSAENYREATIWSDFKNIVELNLSSIENPQISKPEINYNSLSGELRIVGVDGETKLNVYNIAGKLCFTNKTGCNESLILQLLPPGIYLIEVRTNNYQITKKIRII
jgi:hypothetical protein